MGKDLLICIFRIPNMWYLSDTKIWLGVFHEKKTSSGVAQQERKYDVVTRVLHAAAKILGRDTEGLNTKSDVESDGAENDSLMLELCAVCMYQEYTLVFLP
ncbi:hypothetical protein AgCh_006102 [Apium graveolens]